MYDINNVTLLHHTNQSLKARFVFEKDKDYLVQDGKVLIVDEFTGRAMEGRRFSEGLHQAIEAKENLEVQLENQTLAAITYQNYFRLYSKLAGMTGTAKTEADEFFDIYKLEVVQIPPNKPMVRKDEEDEIYSPEKNLLFTFNFDNIDQRVRVASKELIRVYQRENPGAKWAENLHAECNRHVTESRYQVSFRNSKDVLWIHGNADAIKLKKEITLKKSWFISAWVLADDFLLGFDKRSSQKWRTLCSCAVGNEKKYASYHIMLTSFKKDIFIGPYISVPNEGTEKYNGDGIFLPCRDSEGNDVNFYNVLKHGEFNHIAVHGEASVIENGKTIPGWTTVYINGNKVGEVEGVVDLPIQVIGQCASKTKARYGIQRMVDFRVYQMPQEVCLISPSPAVQSVLSTDSLSRKLSR